MNTVTATLAVTLTFQALACARVVQPGLANAPASPTTQGADTRVHDAIANGQDSCGVALDPGPLRFRIPPCPAIYEAATRPDLLPQARPGESGGHYEWLRHGYQGWSCRLGAKGAVDTTLAGWSPADDTDAPSCPWR